MKLFADECVYAKTVAFLRGKGHRVKTVQEEGLSGCKDPELIRYSIEKDFVLLTRDKDFKVSSLPAQRRRSPRDKPKERRRGSPYSCQDSGIT